MTAQIEKGLFWTVAEALDKALKEWARIPYHPKAEGPYNYAKGLMTCLVALEELGGGLCGEPERCVYKDLVLRYKILAASFYVEPFVGRDERALKKSFEMVGFRS